MKKYLLLILPLLFSIHFVGQTRDKAFQINQLLGRGINYGNMFEAPSETAWGNPWQLEYPKIIADLGFDHVRIPIRWEPAERSSGIYPYTVETTFLNRIKQVVDSTLNNGMHAIINMHHHESLYDDPDGQKERFLAQWKQISEFFKDYPDTLLFEILNEPHGDLLADKWNIFLADALAKIREDNPDRIVLIGTAEYGGLGGLSQLQIPDDEYIILTVHYYNPFQFTHQGAEWVGSEADEWLGTEWNDTEIERDVMRQEFAPLLAISQEENIPVHIGEFGAYSTADLASRVRWTTFLSRYLEELNWSWAYWEFSAGFGIYNPVNESLYQELVDALLYNPMPEPAQYTRTTIYSSNFQTNNDGWELYLQGSANAQLTRINNSLKVNITDGGLESWHVQLVKNNFNLEEGKKYALTFNAEANSVRNITSYVGMSISPWSAHSEYLNSTVTETNTQYSTIFDMNSNDNQARIVFDLGKSDVDFTITEVKLEELTLQTLSNDESQFGISTNLYPNPVSDILQIDNSDLFTSFAIYNIHGQLIKKENLINGSNFINLYNFQTGMYVVSLNGSMKSNTFKIMKL